MLKRFALLPIAVSLCSTPVLAATVTGNLAVTATIQESCHLDSTAGGSLGNALIDFGTISSFATAVDADTTTAGGAALSIICTDGTTYDVSAALGNNPDGAQRRMVNTSSATDYLPYDLYADAAYATLIDNSTAFYSGTGNGQTQAIHLYGRIPAGTLLPAAGSYNDLVVLTVTY